MENERRAQWFFILLTAHFAPVWPVCEKIANFEENAGKMKGKEL